MSAPQPLLSATDLHAGYRDSAVLHGVSLYLAPAEVVTLIGPNGAGKSTLLKTLMGYLIPSQGRVVFRGADITRLRPEERVRRGMAYVPQLDNVFPSLTVAETLRMGAYTLPKALLRERLQAVYDLFPLLAARRKQRVRTLSGGERQLLATGRALMTQPALLLLDEPTAALAPQMADLVFEKVRDICAQGTAVLLVEQDAYRALEVSQRGYVLVDGRNAFGGRADRLLHDEQLRQAYLGG
ncbi:MAG: ABC transporter ATP-binding protein [Candidatus Tectimicrobiota bacterium]|nr:MAG: ABC transporter ATP-binding protein [Candidatus Tectomicrobia bacterium]